ncbi:MAG: hypothetical protein IKE55_04245 [Kiritimatiellae bacterium]|nr:hypothetical protein [Kiritimatiellia bacterium]
MRTDRRGQAMIELAIGMFALALVVSALCTFAVYIVRSLEVQNSLRSSSPQMNKPVKVDDFAARHFVGRDSLKMDERVVMPPTEVVR